MKTTIDKAGRLVIPKSIRQRLGLTGGESLEVAERGGRIEIEPVAVAMELKNQDGGLVAVPKRKLPKLTDDLVRETLETTRR